MNRRQVIAIAGGGLAALAGCTTDSQETDTEETGDETESEPAADLAISNAQLNGLPLDEYDVEFPADATPDQIADEFEHELEYDITGASGSVESTVTVEYTDKTIPKEPLNQEIASQQYSDIDSIQQEIQFPDDLVEHIIENPRNIQATLSVEGTDTKQTEQVEFTLNYADQFAENNYREAFDPNGYIDSRLGETELVNLDVEDGVIILEYNSDHKIGSDDFNLEFSGAGVYTGIVDETKTAYELDWTVHDADAETYHQHIDNDLAEEYLQGETTRARRSEMLNEIMFNRLNT